MSLLMLHIVCLSFGQLDKTISFLPSNTVGVISVLVVVKLGFTIFFYSFCIQIEIYHVFTALFGLVFYYEKFFAVKCIANSFASS